MILVILLLLAGHPQPFSHRRPYPATASILVSALSQPVPNRRSFLATTTASAFAAIYLPSSPSSAKCTDIDSCREIGDLKVEQDLQENPVTTLNDGVRFKVLKPGTSKEIVKKDAVVDIIYSVSQGGGQYMYSQGFGFEKVNVYGKQQSDLGLDSYRVTLGQQKLPIGLEEAILGMKKGERRRVELPPKVGLETSNWQPEPTTKRGKASVVAYQRILNGFGAQPPFAAPTIWDVEVINFRNP